MKKQENTAYIDAQNLHLGTTSVGWKVDLFRFRRYLSDKFGVKNAYFFLGFLDESQEDLYTMLQQAGFIVVFREHTSLMKGKKKGNVDVDIVFDIKRSICDKHDFSQIVLVSGDGDYYKMVKYLLKTNRLKKVLFPNKNYSSLYKKIAGSHTVNISTPSIRKKIEYKK